MFGSVQILASVWVSALLTDPSAAPSPAPPLLHPAAAVSRAATRLTAATSVTRTTYADCVPVTAASLSA